MFNTCELPWPCPFTHAAFSQEIVGHVLTCCKHSVWCWVQVKAGCWAEGAGEGGGFIYNRDVFCVDINTDVFGHIRIIHKSLERYLQAEKLQSNEQ